MRTTKDVREMMDKGYKDGTAYKSALPFDSRRGDNIRLATLELAESCGWSYVHNRTLDVGSGEGGIVSFWPHTNIVGVEISQVAIDRARASHPKVDYRCSPIEEFALNAGEKPFDLVVAQESIEHWSDASAGLKAIHRCMKENSALIVTTPNRDSLHCRMRRKLGMPEAPYCSHDHIHEFGFEELLDFAQDHGFKNVDSRGVGLLPYWTLESVCGTAIRHMTDTDDEVVQWFEVMGQNIPPEFAFIQCHLFERVEHKRAD